MFCLHGIRTGTQPESGGIHVTADQLREIVDVSTELGSMVPLEVIVTRLASGKDVAGLVALTFDDACRSVARVAAPILRSAGAHATVFAVQDASSGAAPYWWDRLSLCQPHFDPHHWEQLFGALGEASVPPGPGLERRARDLIVARHRGILPAAAAYLFEEVEASYGLASIYDRALTGAELATLARDPHFGIGVHTVSHPALPLLQDHEVVDQVRQCHRWLLDWIPDALPYLAIPFGLRDDRTYRLARDAGMTSVMRIAARTASRSGAAEGIPRFMASPRRSGWKLQAAILGVYDWAQSMGLARDAGDPPVPVITS